MKEYQVANGHCSRVEERGKGNESVARGVSSESERASAEDSRTVGGGGSSAANDLLPGRQETALMRCERMFFK